MKSLSILAVSLLLATLTAGFAAEQSTNAVTTVAVPEPVAAPVVVPVQAPSHVVAMAPSAPPAVEAPKPAPVTVAAPAAATTPVVVDEGRTWYGRPMRPAELLDRKVRHLRLAQTAAEDAADAAAEALAKVTKADLDRRNAVAVVRPFWFDTSADAVKGASLLKAIKAARLAEEEGKAAIKVQVAANDLEAVSRRLLGRVEREVEVAAMNVRGNTDAAVRSAVSATIIAEQAKMEEERRAAAIPAKQGNL